MSLLCLLAAEPELRAGMAPVDAWLTPSERARLQSLGTAARRDTFLAGRWLARRAVQRWLGRDVLPALDVAPSGACRVAGGDAVFVSISHSAGSVACAVAAVPVGVDIESLRRPRDALGVAQAVHSAAQREALLALPDEARAVAFLELWTLKEAWLKARGQGLDFALMRALSFEDGPRGDVAVARSGDLVLAVAAEPDLPARMDTPQNLSWRRYRTRRVTP